VCVDSLKITINFHCPFPAKHLPFIIQGQRNSRKSQERMFRHPLLCDCEVRVQASKLGFASIAWM